MHGEVSASALRSWRAWTQLVAGLLGFGVGVALMVRSGLGLGPWDALHVGLSRQAGVSIGAAAIGVGALIVAGSLPWGIRPGPGTLLNMVLVGGFIDLVLPLVPPAGSLVAGLAYYAAGLPVCGLATGGYMAARLGKGPRDGLMVGVSRRTGHSIRLVRTAIELVVLLLGWLLGGPVGLGTLLFAAGIGPAVQWGMRVFGLEEQPRPTVEP